MRILLRRVLVSRARCFAMASAIVVLLGASVGAAEIFKWQDEAGRLHFAQDLNQVPPKYRLQAKGEAMEEGKGGVIQHYESRPAAPRATRARSRTTKGSPSTKIYRVRVQRTGSSMRVNVRLNDRVTAPFYIDTGASDVSLPEWVARELGLDLEGGRTALYNTANGTVKSALVTLDSVELGGARVENVPAHISKTMSVGLLGLSFFNHFNYRVDPASGIVTLSPNGLAKSGEIRGGRSAGQWKGEFARLAHRRARIEEVLEHGGSSRTRRRAELEAALEENDRQLRLLEEEADDARVPMRWRD